MNRKRNPCTYLVEKLEGDQIVKVWTRGYVIDRDIKKRERTHDNIIEQYNETVKPMYNKFIKPTKTNSDIIIKNINKTDNGYIKLMEKINNLIN